MSDTALALNGSDTTLPGESSDAQRYDGSRTPPDVQYEIMRRHHQQMSITAIAEDCHCDPRTVKAVIQNWGTAQHTLRLQAHRSQVVDSLILGMQSAAEKGKLDSLLSLSDRLGITEPVKSANQLSVGVQVVLNGGAAPSELSLAKVTETSETLLEQAQSGSSLISPIMSTMDTPQPAVTQALTDSTFTITQDTQEQDLAWNLCSLERFPRLTRRCSLKCSCLLRPHPAQTPTSHRSSCCGR